MSLRTPLSRNLRIGGLPVLWAVAALLMVRDSLQDPYDPNLEGTARYGHNSEGALPLVLLGSLLELLVACLILRPGSSPPSWIRSRAAFVLFFPWTAVSMVLVMHTGGLYALHFLWLATLLLVLLGFTVWGAVDAWLSARRLKGQV